MLVVKPIDFEPAIHALRNVPGAAGKAIRLSINDTVKRTRAETIRQITKRYNITKKDLTKGDRKGSSIDERYASGSGTNLKGGVIISGSRLPIFRFKPEPDVVDVAPQKRPVIMFNIIKGQREKITGAFIATMAQSSGHTGLFVRTGEVTRADTGKYRDKLRAKIDERFSISIAEMVSSHAILDDLEQLIADYFEKRLAHQIKRLV